MDMDDKIVTAIAAVMKDVPKLAKGDKNSHGNYNFTSIDDFLEAVRPLMAKAGLVISSDEQDFEVIGEGKDAWLKLLYAFTAHAGGASYGPLHRRAMVRASMGSQAFGAAQSYAEKQFLRSLFKIATGDGATIDADSHAQANLPTGAGDRRRPAAQGMQKREPLTGPMMTRKEAHAVYGEIVRDLYACEDSDALEACLVTYKPQIDQFERELPLAWNGDGMELPGLNKEITDARERVAA